jgi:hypothetical protein
MEGTAAYEEKIVTVPIITAKYLKLKGRGQGEKKRRKKGRKKGRKEGRKKGWWGIRSKQEGRRGQRKEGQECRGEEGW